MANLNQIDLASGVYDIMDATARKCINEYNVSKLHPTEGTGGTNRYTLANAIAKIPAEYRTIGIKCSFVDEKGTLVCYQFKGGNITVTGSWAKAYLTDALDKMNPYFICSLAAKNQLPNIDTTTKTIDFGEDPVIVIGRKSYALKNLTPDRRNISLENSSGTSALRLVFNLSNYKIYSKAYSVMLDEDEVTLGAYRLFNPIDFYLKKSSFCFQFTINNKNFLSDDIEALENKIDKQTFCVSLVPTSYGNFNNKVNIDTVKKVIDFGPDPVFCFKDQALTIADFSNCDLRNIPYYVEGSPSGAISLILNYIQKKIYVKLCSEKLTDGELLFGSLRLEYDTHNFIAGNFPFEYTVDSKEVWTKDVESARSTAKQLRCKTGLTFIAHRGMHIGIPENSLDAYRYAGYCGFDYAETDFCATKDGELVLMHDETINRTMRNAADYSEITTPVKVSDKTLAELRNNYVLIADDPRMRRQIPTLEEFFITCKNSGVFPVPEIKSTSATTQPMVKKAYEIGKRICGEGNFGFCSFSAALLDYARTLSEKTLLLYINNGILGTNNSINNKSRVSPTTWWYPSHDQITKVLMQQYKEAGIKVAVWTTPVNKFDDLLKVGVDCIATDYISPDIDNMIGQVVNSDVDFSSFTTDGSVVNKTMILAAGQKLSLNGINIPSLGGYHLSIVGKGAFTVSAPYLKVDVNSPSVDRFIYQGMIYQQKANITITASAPSEIQFINISVVQF